MAAYLGEIILVGFTFAPRNFAFCNGQLLSIAQNNALFALLGTTYGGNGVTTFALPDLRGRAPIHKGQGSGLSSYTLGDMGGAESVTLTASQMPAHTHAIDLSPMSATARCRNAAATTASPVGAVHANEPTGAGYTDPTLTATATLIKAVHISELRTLIDGARAVDGLGQFSYTDPSLTAGTTVVRGQHIIDLRTSLNAVYSARKLTPPSYTDPALAAGTSIKAVHLSELRTAVDAVVSATSALKFTNAAADANMGSSAIAVAGTPVASNTGGALAHNNMQPYLTLHYCIALTGVFPTQN